MVPKFGDVQDRQNWRLHPTVQPTCPGGGWVQPICRLGNGSDSSPTCWIQTYHKVNLAECISHSDSRSWLLFVVEDWSLALLFQMRDDKVIPVKVAVRCRPLIPKEINEGCSTCVQFVPGEPQIILGTNKVFTFDYVFSPTTSNETVHLEAANGLVESIFKGRHHKINC